MTENDAVKSTDPPQQQPLQPPPSRPTLTLPPRTASFESLFTGSGFGFGLSPGPMTLVSSLFSSDGDPDSDCRSFSQLLAGAMSPPVRSNNINDSSDPVRFKENRPPGLVVNQHGGGGGGVFTVPPGLSPASLLDSPGLFPGQGPFGMSHQQALAQVTAQAAQAQANLHMQTLGTTLQQSAPFPSFTTTPMQQNTMPSVPDSNKEINESFQFSSAEQRSQPSSIVVDKPADDGYNWRKYGQKQVKGSEYPRSYYKCTHPSCPVKKKVERSLDGQVTEIIYKGQHNHPPPQKKSKDGGNPNGNMGSQGNQEFSSQSQGGNVNSMNDGMSHSMSRRDQESSQATAEHISSDEEEVGNDGTRENEEVEDEPDSKRRNTEVRVEQTASHRTVTEPRIIVQTTSEVDLLDDGYRWRKYGQKVVKGNPYPRSYYKCTSQGCNVRKHVERAASDPKAVITTYEGKHNHDVPAARTSSHTTANHNASQLKPNNSGSNNDHAYIGKSGFTNSNQPVALLRLKEERIT